MRVRAIRTVLSCVGVLGVCACSSPVSTDPKDYVGEYLLRPANADSSLASFIILEQNGTAFEVRFSKSSGRIDTTREPWGISQTTSENLDVGNAGHPIEVSGNGVRLIVNEDLGEYYEKVR